MPRPELNESDWREIYYALNSKLRYIKDGMYEAEPGEPGADLVNEAWVEQLESIIHVIGPDGQRMLEPPAYDTKPATPEFTVTLPELDPKNSCEIKEGGVKTQVCIRTHDDSLEIQVADGLKLILEREYEKTRVFVIPSDGDDECAYIEATDAICEYQEAQVMISNAGGMLLLDSSRIRMNYGPPVWRDNRNNVKELGTLDNSHLLNILRMCVRVAKYFGGTSCDRMLPMIYLSLEQEAIRRRMDRREWESAPSAQADWNKGLDHSVRSRFGMSITTYTDTVEGLHAALADAAQQIALRSVHNTLDTRHQFWAFYDPDDVVAHHLPQPARGRVVLLTEGQELPRNDGS